MLLTSPTSNTSLYDLVYLLLVRAGGGSDRNCLLVLIPKGVTLGHCSKMPGLKAGGVGCQTPGSVDGGRKVSLGDEPSLARNAIIAAAEAAPTATPLSLAGPFGI